MQFHAKFKYGTGSLIWHFFKNNYNLKYSYKFGIETLKLDTNFSKSHGLPQKLYWTKSRIVYTHFNMLNTIWCWIEIGQQNVFFSFKVDFFFHLLNLLLSTKDNWWSLGYGKHAVQDYKKKKKKKLQI